jgi:hypothetical protein
VAGRCFSDDSLGSSNSDFNLVIDGMGALGHGIGMVQVLSMSMLIIKIIRFIYLLLAQLSCFFCAMLDLGHAVHLEF